LLGNPSDGFGGKTIALTIPAFAARVTVTEAGAMRVDADPPARRLIEATVRRLDRDRPVSARRPRIAAALTTEIPLQVGLGGSSAIVIATLRALAELWGLELGPAELAELALAVEVEDLGIPAGPQDRVVQAHEGLVYMDFDPAAAQICERLDPGLLPALFVAYSTDAAQPSATPHGELRSRLARGDREARAVIEEIAALAEAGRSCLLAPDHETLGRLMRENVAARARLIALDPRHLRLIELADSLGAPANYAGSGGAIIGLLPDDLEAGALIAAFAAERCRVLAPLAPLSAA
jgi:glucuronokinase